MNKNAALLVIFGAVCLTPFEFVLAADGQKCTDQTAIVSVNDLRAALQKPLMGYSADKAFHVGDAGVIKVTDIMQGQSTVREVTDATVTKIDSANIYYTVRNQTTGAVENLQLPKSQWPYNGPERFSRLSTYCNLTAKAHTIPVSVEQAPGGKIQATRIEMDEDRLVSGKPGTVHWSYELTKDAPGLFVDYEECYTSVVAGTSPLPFKECTKVDYFHFGKAER